MEFQSIIYGSIVFLALIFGDLGVTGVAAVSGPLAALILEIEAIRKHRELASLSTQDATSIHSPRFEKTYRHYPAATGLANEPEQFACR